MSMLNGLKKYTSNVVEEAGRIARPLTDDQRLENKQIAVRGLISDLYKSLHSPELGSTISKQTKMEYFRVMETLLRELSGQKQSSFEAEGGEGPCPFLTESGLPSEVGPRVLFLLRS